MRGRLVLRLLLAATLVGGAAVAHAARAPSLETVMAAILPKFLPYVTWPATALPAPGAPFVICVVGRDPFGPLLDDAAAEERPGTPAVMVRRVGRIDRTSPCHIAYIGGSDSQSVTAAVRALGSAPVLTVTDARTSRERGMVHFERSGGQVRFHIDDAAARHAGLAVSSKLLGVALSVRERGRS